MLPQMQCSCMGDLSLRKKLNPKEVSCHVQFLVGYLMPYLRKHWASLQYMIQIHHWLHWSLGSDLNSLVSNAGSVQYACSIVATHEAILWIVLKLVPASFAVVSCKYHVGQQALYKSWGFLRQTDVFLFFNTRQTQMLSSSWQTFWQPQVFLLGLLIKWETWKT